MALRTGLFPEVFPLCQGGSVDGDSGPEVVPSISPATGSREQFIWTPATWEVFPLTSHKAGRQAGGLQGPAWHPGVVAQARGSVKGSSQELSTIQVLLLVAVVRACMHNVVQVLPEE